MNTQSVQMVLETNKFRELMREAYELSCIAQQPKYNLQSEESLIEYEKWAPYVLNTGSNINSVGFKIHMIEMMSILLVMKDEENNRDRYRVSADEIKEMYNVNPPREIFKQLPPEIHTTSNDVYDYSSQKNVVSFSQYKMRKR